MARTDPHSYFDDAQPRTRHLGLELEVDFEGRCLHGWAMLDLGEPSSGPLDLDTKGLDIYSVEGEDDEEEEKKGVDQLQESIRTVFS